MLVKTKFCGRNDPLDTTCRQESLHYFQIFKDQQEMPIPLQSETTSKGQKLAQRLSRIVARLHQGDSINKHQLASDFGVDVRTIERDLGERLQGIAERNPEGEWQLTRDARSTIPATHLQSYARMAGTKHLFPDDSLRYLITQLDDLAPVFQDTVYSQYGACST